ncbi:MAG TPA: hypothetical protein VJ961_08115 [Mariprofundaceae bacterium]|nr:hypothetical protein [Mariprofundaceae bacterium]
MPEKQQLMWLQQLLLEHAPASRTAWRIWLETDTASAQAGTPAFLERVSIMLRQRGAMANLSLRENLLLPFLYHAEAEALLQAETDLPAVAEFLGLTDELDRQAGECSPYTHRLISLGRALLQKPAIIVAQDIHVGIPFEDLPAFRTRFAEALKQLRSGLLYLASSEQEDWGLHFDQPIRGSAS